MLKTKLEVLSSDDLQRVHQASLKILSETGVVFMNDESLEIFKK
ncbi:MAG: trimethylamine methyltransferase family protein, partial [Bacillota bacterium]|nr:trimethylamine methyltransferase family protein [Bacillota bacterium]